MYNVYVSDVILILHIDPSVVKVTVQQTPFISRKVIKEEQGDHSEQPSKSGQTNDDIIRYYYTMWVQVLFKFIMLRITEFKTAVVYM